MALLHNIVSNDLISRKQFKVILNNHIKTRKIFPLNNFIHKRKISGKFEFNMSSLHPFFFLFRRIEISSSEGF